MGVLSVAGFARISRSFVRRPTVHPTKFRERSGAPCFRKICFFGGTESVVTPAARSRRRANVRLGFNRLRRDSRQCRCRSVGDACKSGARSGTVDVRVRNAMTFGKRAKLFAESLTELCARVFAVELCDETGADLGGAHCFALVGVGAITKSLLIHYLHHFQRASLAFGPALR